MNPLALDIGGANLKAAHADGTRSVAFPLWKEPDRLPSALREIADGLAFDGLAVTMTGELCDCFVTKREGVRAIVSAVAQAFPGRQARIWGTDGRFHAPDEACDRPELAAASNWLALATVAARMAGGGEGLLIDIGSTTSDLIPLSRGRPIPRGRTDTARLASGELVYAGVKRTPVCALATSIRLGDASIGLAAELFATTRDVYLTLGDLDDAPGDRDTADGRPATSQWARDRLARMIGADRETFSEEDAAAFAREADALLTDRLIASARIASRGATPDVAVISGSGEFLARRAAVRLLGVGGRIVSLSESWGRGASEAACAVALHALAIGGNPR